MEHNIAAFHPQAARRFDQIAGEIQQTVQAFGNLMPPPGPTPRIELFPSAIIAAQDIISASKFIKHVDNMGEQTAVRWLSGNMWVGWDGAAFQRIKEIAAAMERSLLSGQVSVHFLLDEICLWLSETLERERGDPLSVYIAKRCEEEIKEFEIWIPLFQTYSSTDFSIGQVSFRTITKAIMEEYWNRAREKLGGDAAAEAALNEMRSKLQGTLAACSRVRAEQRKATEMARSAADNATALLRFLSPANFDSRLVSYCTLAESEQLGSGTELLMRDGTIIGISRHVRDQRSADWLIDKSLAQMPGILNALDSLASNTSTEMRRSLYDAMILHSRQSQADEPSDKLVFTLVALESILLRDTSEPIQENLALRMAFLVGKSIQERKDIVRAVKTAYNARSAFVHHGQKANHIEVLNQFLGSAWKTFARILELVDRYQTKAAFHGWLEDLKMSAP